MIMMLSISQHEYELAVEQAKEYGLDVQHYIEETIEIGIANIDQFQKFQEKDKEYENRELIKGHTPRTALNYEELTLDLEKPTRKARRLFCWN